MSRFITGTRTQTPSVRAQGPSTFNRPVFRLSPYILHLQVVDEARGPATKREYGVAMVPAGDALVGQTVDFMGRRPGGGGGGGAQLGADVLVPLFNEQLDMESREQINQALTTGVKVRFLGLKQVLSKEQLCLDH